MNVGTTFRYKDVGTGGARGAMAPSSSNEGGPSVTLPPPKVKKKIAETAQGVVWIKRNVITNHIM